MLAPNAADDPGRPVALTERAVATDPRNRYYLNTLGAALYRAGRFEEAVRRLGESVAVRPSPGTSGCSSSSSAGKPRRWSRG